MDKAQYGDKGFGAVSYTNLDVYKRQTAYSADNSSVLAERMQAHF